jgi:hypothetical protein
MTRQDRLFTLTPYANSVSLVKPDTRSTAVVSGSETTGSASASVNNLPSLSQVLAAHVRYGSRDTLTQEPIKRTTNAVCTHFVSLRESIAKVTKGPQLSSGVVIPVVGGMVRPKPFPTWHRSDRVIIYDPRLQPGSRKKTGGGQESHQKSGAIVEVVGVEGLQESLNLLLL